MAARKKSTAKEAPGFEVHLAALEEAVRALESDELTLEEALAKYQGGAEHLQACRALLDAAESRLAELVEGGAERPLEVTEQGLEDA